MSQLEGHTSDIRDSVLDGLHDLESYVIEQRDEATTCLDDAERYLNGYDDLDPAADRSENDEAVAEIVRLALCEIADARSALDEL